MHAYYDFLIVGAGFSGAVIAERLARVSGKRCLVIDRRTHIAGNAFDCYDDAGVLIHPYGPHYFRTNSDRVREYLSQFTEWQPANYKILSYTDGRFWNFRSVRSTAVPFTPVRTGNVANGILSTRRPSELPE